MKCEAIRDLLEAYALDALEPAERASVEAHLVTCADCRALARQYADAVNRLPQAVALAAGLRPPAALKERLMASIQTPATEPKRVGVAAPVTKPARPMLSARLRAVWRYASAAAVILLIAAGVWIAHLNTVLAQEQSLRTRLLKQTETIFEVVDSDKTMRLFLRPLKTAPVRPSEAPPYGKVFTRADMPYVVAMTGRMAAPPAGQAYFLWLFHDNTTTLAGQVVIDEHGFGTVIYTAGADGPSYQMAQVTLQAKNPLAPGEQVVLKWQATP